jgi:hypothetical protein
MDGERTRIAPTTGGFGGPQSEAEPPREARQPPDREGSARERAIAGEIMRAPLGRIVGARSGDKGGNANLGVWTKTDEAFAWLDSFLDVERLRTLMPETKELEVHRYALPNIRAINFVIVGLLGEGVASSVRQDPQAKALGEYLRAKVVEIPAVLLD